jgi:hypothetical protein
MHRTETVDYAIVLEGEIVAMLDDSETVLRAGDILIQRGTSHAWANRSGKPARTLPAGVGSARVCEVESSSWLIAGETLFWSHPGGGAACADCAKPKISAAAELVASNAVRNSTLFKPRPLIYLWARSIGLTLVTRPTQIFGAEWRLYFILSQTKASVGGPLARKARVTPPPYAR